MNREPGIAVFWLSRLPNQALSSIRTSLDCRSPEKASIRVTMSLRHASESCRSARPGVELLKPLGPCGGHVFLRGTRRRQHHRYTEIVIPTLRPRS